MLTPFYDNLLYLILIWVVKNRKITLDKAGQISNFHVKDLETNLKWDISEGIPIYMTGHSDIEDVHGKIPINIPCISGRCLYSLTYSLKTTKLLPAPFSTNCHNYTLSGFSSRENCITECLNKKSTKRDMILDRNILTKDRFQNSTLTIISDLPKLRQFLMIHDIHPPTSSSLVGMSRVMHPQQKNVLRWDI